MRTHFVWANTDWLMYLHRGVAPAPELEGGCEDRVEVAPAGREGGAHHRGRDEAVDGSRIPSKNT